MNSRTVKILAVIAVILLAVVVLMDSTDKGSSVGNGDLLISDLKGQLNDVRTFSVTMAGGDETVSIENDGGAWVVPELDRFPADVGKIREVLLAIADAKTVERKTSNPERYDQLGVGESGTRISIEGNQFTYDLIIGNTAQTNYRYARLADDTQSWLIDKNPDLPVDSGGWLHADIIDIEAARVSAVSIEHPDGEFIRLNKENQDDTNYTVLDIPEGRELSYPTVANGIAGALTSLSLESVKKGNLTGDVTLTTFETSDGLEISVRSESIDSEVWISLSAFADGDAAAEAEEINQRVSGWLYRIPEYKANMLRRSWQDILQAEDEAE